MTEAIVRPHYKNVPKLVAENLAYRRGVLEATANSPTARERFRVACKRDLLFWLNMFGWTYDPRKKHAPVIPFVTWPFQDEALSALEDAVGDADVLLEKSRDMGASWMCLALFLHRWQFFPNQTFALISRVETLVDKPGDSDSLFWKLDFLLKHQPEWLVPRYERLKLHLANLDNGSTIDGFSTTGNVLRGGRRTAVLVDEFAAFERADGYAALAATQHATRCRLFNSTPQGAVGAFYDMANSPIRKVRMHWSQHPEKCRGLYHDERGKMRSPWYDEECRRMPVAALIAQELDIDYVGSASQFFDGLLLDRCILLDSREPYAKGTLSSGIFVEGGNELSLWCHVVDGRPPEHEDFVVGCDISAGTGATNSVASVASRTTGEKVAELATPYQGPEVFAQTVVDLAKWFNNAYLLWESNGPGSQFGRRVVDLNYLNCYYRRNERTISRKEQDAPGWSATRENRRVLLGQYASALSTGKFVNRSRQALNECRDIVYMPDGNIGNNRAAASGDPSGARENHADRPTADALACKGLYEVGALAEDRSPPPTPDQRSFEGRRKIREQARAAEEPW